MRTILAFFATALLVSEAFAHGGVFSPPPGSTPKGGDSPGLPTQPTTPSHSPGGASSSGGWHTWTTWWGFNRFKYLDFRVRQAERSGPVSGERTGPVDPHAWREKVRTKFTPLLLEAIRDRDDEVRMSAAVALGKWRVKDAVEPLKKMRVKDNTEQTREAGLLGLILMRDPSLFEYLKGIVEDRKEKDRMRGYALLGIGMIGDEAARDYIFSLLDSKSRKGRRVLPRAENKRRALLCAGIAGLAHERDAKLGERFLDVARDKRLVPEVRAYALAAAGKVGAAELAPAVAEILKRNQHKEIRQSAAVALGGLGTPDEAAIKALDHGLRTDRDRIVNHFSAISLGQIGGPRAFKVLAKRYRRANKEARGFYLIAFGLCRESGAVPILEKVIRTSGSANDRAAAALALGLYDDKKNREIVRKTFASAKDWLLLESTMVSLGLLDDKVSADPIKDVLITKKMPSVRSSAALSYALLRQWRAVTVFTDIISTARSVQTLSTVSQIMGYLPSEKAAEPLAKLCRDKQLQRQVRGFAVVALGALGDPEPLPILVRLAFYMNYMIPADPVDQVVTML
ncbi:MAG: HEAT repeat domain-containing protein [Planctomycetota bacterium]|nr:HEAT repeat domain-containing protein [Planctomycetota bacterium]